MPIFKELRGSIQVEDDVELSHVLRSTDSAGPALNLPGSFHLRHIFLQWVKSFFSFRGVYVYPPVTRFAAGLTKVW